MELRTIQIRNFRALQKIDFPISSFSCVIGENNVGKSSLLQALIRFCDGKKLQATDCYDAKQPVIIQAELTGITDDDLSLLADEHQTKIKSLIVNGSLKLMRKYDLDGSGSLRSIKKIPKDERLRPDVLAEFVKGKKGATLASEAAQQYPEIAAQIPSSPTQAKIRELVEEYVRSLAETDLVEADCALETGIDNSIIRLLPEPVYIPAVKDIGDDMKAKDSATFGKVLGLLLNVIEPKLADAKELFENLDKKFNRVKGDDGSVADKRLDEIREVEQTIETHLKEHFPQATVEVRIPPPDVKTILSSAKIDVNDGLPGPIETKGDGLKRSVMFAIFRSFVELTRKKGWQKKSAGANGQARYLFLYEEPELYLHPKAQKTLFEALAVVTKDHQVAVTTHSPLFFSADATTTFAKMLKHPADSRRPKPFSELLPVELTSEMPFKDAFQLLCFENNNIAFFATDVVLVEGDTDIIAFKHIAKKLNPAWDFDKGRVMMLRVSGKSNFRRFTEFFGRFGIRVHIIADLDLVARDFDKLGFPADAAIHQERSTLLQEVDKVAGTAAPDADRIKKLFTQRTWRERWTDAIAAMRCFKAGVKPTDDQIALMELMLEEERHQPRIDTLKGNTTIRSLKRNFLSALRTHNVHVMDRGEIEDYYPSEIVGGDKSSKAEDFTKKVVTKDAIIGLCESVPDGGTGTEKPEFEVMFMQIFGVDGS